MSWRRSLEVPDWVLNRSPRSIGIESAVGSSGSCLSGPSAPPLSPSTTKESRQVIRIPRYPKCGFFAILVNPTLFELFGHVATPLDAASCPNHSPDPIFRVPHDPSTLINTCKAINIVCFFVAQKAPRRGPNWVTYVHVDSRYVPSRQF